MDKGNWYAAAAYAWWGFSPVYWKSLHHVSPFQVIGHRIFWSALILIGTVLILGQWKDFCRAALNRRALRIYTASGVLISANWALFVWGVSAGYILECSPGYFMTPLVSVFLGVVVLRERLRPLQWAGIGVATAGVLYMTWAYGSPPWISLALAGTFSVYGLVKKKAPLGSLHGLTVEAATLLVPSFLYLLACERAGEGAFLRVGPATDLLLFGAGWATTLPLLAFALAARRISLILIGILQYISPAVQILIAVAAYGEPFTVVQAVGFGAVWSALGLFALEGLFPGLRSRPRKIPGRAAG